MITSFYAISLGILYLILTARVITYRRAKKIGLGDSGDKGLMKRMRAQANFVETAPFALILLMLLEFGTDVTWIIHVLGATLLIGRVMHAIGFSARPPNMKLRKWGMGITLFMMAFTVLVLFIAAVRG